MSINIYYCDTIFDIFCYIFC